MKDNRKNSFTMGAFIRIVSLGSKVSQWVLLVTALIIFYDVVMRYVFNHPATWVHEISEYMMVFLTFIGMAEVQKHKAHIKMDFFYARFSQNIRKYLDLFFYLFMALFSLLLLLTSYHYGSKSNSLLETPLIIPYAIVPVGVCLLFLQSIIDVLQSLKDI